MKIVISSSLTFFYKYIFCGYAVFIVSIVFFGGIFFGDMASIAMCIGFSPIAITLVICLIKFLGIPLKKISRDMDYLYISNFFKTIKVPFSQIMDVTENKWSNPHLVWIHLYRKTIFGNKIMFMAEFRFIDFKSHPIVEELKELKMRNPNRQG